MSSSGSSVSGVGVGALCEDALVEILVRLPSESVVRCRAVCKAWHRVATDVSFLAAHAAHRPRELLVLTACTVSVVPLSPDDLGAAVRGRCLLRDTSVYHQRNGTRVGSCDVVASLDGLLLLQQRRGLYIVCNPATRQWTNLPVLAPRPCSTAFPCGFYYHGGSREYRLLCHGKQATDNADDDWIWHDGDEYCYYVLSAGSTLARRLAAHAPCPPDRRPFMPGLLYEAPVAHRGVLYWLKKHPEATTTGTEATTTGKMLAFHTHSETFCLVPRPPPMVSLLGDDDDTTPPQQALLELDDELCALAMRQAGTQLEIWALVSTQHQQHYDDDDCCWALRHRVVVPPPPPVESFFLTGATSAGGGAILVRSGVLRLYHLKERRVEQMEMHPNQTLLPFTESLVRHDFFHDDAARCPDLATIKFPSPTDDLMMMGKFCWIYTIV